jgi:uncharacterized membrane protein
MSLERSDFTACTACLLLFAVAACTEPSPPTGSSEQTTSANQSGPAFEVTETPPPPPAEQTGQSAAPVPAEPYSARGQEPGWLLTIADGWIDYQGNYGEKKIRVRTPSPRTTDTARHYQTERLTIEVTHGRCNDAMSGQGYADQVKIIADGETYEGCGGERRTEWDT